MTPNALSMNRLDSLQMFVRVAELSSFTQAAEQLGLPKARVSTAVQQLEGLLGTRLLHRTTRTNICRLSSRFIESALGVIGLEI